MAPSLKIIWIKIKNYLRPCEPLFSLLKERTRLAEVALEGWSWVPMCYDVSSSSSMLWCFIYTIVNTIIIIISIHRHTSPSPGCRDQIGTVRKNRRFRTGRKTHRSWSLAENNYFFFKCIQFGLTSVGMLIADLSTWLFVAHRYAIYLCSLNVEIQ